MNKVFRVIWSQAAQSWVAVSELTKAHKKQSSSNKQKSADGFSGKVIKYSAIALSLLSGHSVYAALNQPGTGDGNGVAWGENSTGTGYAAVAIGKGALSSSNSTVALGQDAKATGSGASALSVGATASGNNTVAISYKSNASGTRATAIGEESNASSEDGIALGYKTQATSDSAVAIGREVVSSGDSAVALGKGSKATGRGSLALANKSNATGNDSYAIGWSSDASAESTMAFGHSSKAKKNYDIAFGRGAETRDQGAGHSIAIGYGASAASNRAGLDSNPNSTGTLNSAGGVAIGTGAYTGINRNNTAINSSVAVGAGAGAGYRGLGADGLPTGNGTDPDNNATVLVKAFGGTTSTLDYFKNTGSANANGFFSYQNVDINEATAVGRNTRAIGDQSVAIGAQSIAGQGSIVIGGNDIQAYDGKKYFKAANPNSADARSVNDFNAETTPGTGKNNQPITIRDKYAELVGAGLDNSYRASYGQDGSTVIGMQAHSTTPLGVAIGTNSIVRKGAFGATAIGSGASVVANAEAAVAIGMGAEAQGNYAVAAGTAAKAKESAVAAGYQAKADESAVAVGDSSKAATSSVAVGKGAVSEKVSDIAIGQGANAKGEQGAIAMGLGTIAQGHSSIMIGGSDISTAADQPVKYTREKITGNGTPELYDGTITEVINGKTVTRTVKLVRTETVTGKKLSDAYREITGYHLNTASLNYNSPDNKNGHASISMGIHSLSKGDMGVAIGTAARADALGSLALGTGAHASMQNSVAIGTGAVADEVSKGTRQTDISYDEDGNVVGTNSPRAKYTFKWAGGTNTSEGDVVSFGTPGAERQLKNVAAGRVAEDSTDAVNGSQLNAITRSLSQTITNGWQVGGNNKFRVSNIGNDGRVNFLDGLGTAVNIAEINQAEDIDGNKLVKIWGDFYKASDFTNGKLKADAQKVAAAKIKKQPTGANVTFDVKEVNSTLSVTPVGLKVTTGEVTANTDGTMNTPFDKTTEDDTKDHTTKAKNAEVTAAMNNAEDALLASQKVWREKNDAYQRTELAYLAAEAALTKGNEAVEAIQADIVTTQKELKTAQDILARDKDALQRAQTDVNNDPTNIQKQSVLHKANEKVDSTQFLVDQRNQKLTHQQATLTERQSQVSMLEQEKTKADTVRNAAKGVHEEANNDLTKKKEAFDTAKKAFVDAGANQIATVQNVADSINASGWTLQQGATDKDLVQPGDKVSFVDGNGTTASVENTDGKTSTVKYDVKTTTIAVETGDATKEGKAKAGEAGNTFATAETVASAINDAYWIAAASGNGVTTDVADKVKAGTKVTFDAGKNIEIDHSTANKFTFKTVDNPVFTTVQIGSNQGPKITNDGDNLKVTKADSTSPTKITNVANGEDNNDAVNVSQLKASGWNIAGNDKTKVDTINKDDQVNFLDGSGTTVSVTKDTGTADNVNVKYDVNVGNGLQKDPTGNTISVKPADKSLEVTNEGVKVKAADNTLTTDNNGLKVNTGNITASSVPTVADADKDKIATVGNVADAIKAAAWKATSAATTSGENTGKKEQEVKAGDTVTFEADKNIKITQAEGKFTFATKDDVKFNSVQLGGDNGPKLTKTDGNDLKVSGSNGTDPVKITNVADGNISADSKDAINGSQFNAVANNNIKLGGDNASETNVQNLNKAGGLKFNINGADGIETKASGDSVTVKINAETKAKIDSVDNKADKDLSNITADGETKIKNLVTWKAKASNSGDEVVEANKTADSDTDAQQVGADGVLTLDAGKNLLLKRSEKTFTYALSKTLSDLTSAEFKKGDVTTKIDGDGLTIQAPTPTGGTAPKAITVNKDGISAGDKAIKDVNSGLTNYGGTDAKKDLINLGNPITGSKVPDSNAATVGDLRNMGWVVSSDKTTDNTEAPYSEAVKNADEVKFVGKHAAKVSGKTENGVRTITVDVEVPSVETAKITKNNDGSVTGPAGETLTKALKDAKDALAKLPKNADPETVKAAQDKVDEAQKAIDDSPNSNKVATAQNVADMINNSGFTLKTNKAEGGEKDTASTGEEVINPGKAVEMVAGKNLTVKQEANGKVTYSLNPVLSSLTSAEFKGTDANAPTTKLTNDGVTITPATTGKSPVSLTENGLNNGGNAITNVAGNLNGAENEAAKPDNADTIKNNAATVGDVLNAGWNLQGNGTAKDFVTAYDTVNFINGDGTTVSVENTDKITSTIKYSVNTGNGLQKDPTGNTISVKPADKSLEVTNEGVKVKAADNTLTTDNNGLKVNTGNITASSVPTVADADKDKIATVGNVADAIKAAAWKATSAATTSGENTGTKVHPVKAGDTVTFEADKNIKIAQADGKFTFSTKDNVEFTTVKVGDTTNGKKPVELKNGDVITANNNPEQPTTALNVSSDGKSTQITGVGSVLNTDAVPTMPAGTATDAAQQPKLVNLGTGHKQTALGDNVLNAAATVRDLASMGWVVSSDKTTDATGEYKDVVKNANEVKFVGEGTAVVSGKTVGGVRTITVKVDDQVSTNNAVTPVVYTKADGTKVYPVKNEKGVIEYHTTPDGKGAGDEKVDDDKVITSVNGPKGTKTPTTLSNVEGNLNGAKTGTNAPTTNAAAPNTTDATKPNYVNTHNAATVGDVLNAGWNLQNNGTAKDFVKPFDTVNFVNGGNTTAVVTTKADGTTSDVTFNVTGLPIATTIATPDGPVQLTKVGDNYYPVKADGTPDIKTDTDGNPTNGYVKADNGNYYPAGDVTFTKDPATKVTTVTPKDGKQPVTFGNSLTNPNVVNTTDAPNKAVAAPTTLNNVKGNLPTVNDADKTAHNVDGTAIDGKNNTAAPITAKDAANLLNPYKVDKDGKYLDANGNITTDPAQRVANPNFVGNNAATVSDVLNAGWNLQNNGTAKDFVKPYDTVNFINGANTTAVVTTNAEGTASNVTYNVTGLPVTYTTADGTPVSKIGDKFYKVNDKGQPVDEQGNPSTKVNNNGEPIDGNGNVIKPVDTSTNPLSTNLVNPNVTEPNKKTTSPTQLGNVTSGLQKYGDQVNGANVPGTNDKNRGLVDLSKPTTGEPKVSDNTAATVGDLRNMGWIVSADKTTGDLTKTYSDTVKNANEVKFVGEGTATVTGKTDDKGVRTITVKVDDQVSTNNAIMPTSFTTKDGKKVYPVKDDEGNVAYHTTPDGKGAGDTTIDPKNVVTAVSGPNGTTMPTTLQNVKSNLPNVDDKKQKAFHPDGTEVTEPNSTTNTGNTKAPLSHTVVAAMMSPFMTNEEGNFIDENGNVTTDPKQYVRNPNFAGNNAATVSDVLNAGWNLQGNGSAVDFVKPFDTVNFVNGKGTKAVVETADNLTSTVKFDVDAGEITAEKTKDGKVTGKVVGPTTQELKDALEAAKKEAEANPTDEAKQKALKDAQSKVDAANNQVATAQNVADMINASGFTLKTSATADGKKESGDDEVINPGKAVEMVAGKNLTVKQEANGKVTYATKDDVSFNTVNVGEPETYKNAAGETVVKGNDGKFYKPNELNADGKPNKGATGLERDKVTVEKNPQVTLKREAAKKAKNNDAANEPSSALNVSSSDGKPTQITGVGSTLNVKPVDTNPNGKATTGDARPNLVDLVGTKDAPVNKNAAATVGDLQNMGWVVSTEKGNGYKDVVKNANQVDFKGGAGISVEGKTEGNVRKITISVKDGEVVKPNQFTAKVDGKDTPVTKVGDKYYNTKDIDPKTGKPKTDPKTNAPLVTPVTPDKDTTPTNAGDGYVTGHKVAAAIQKSGFVVGKQKDALSAANFEDKDEKVNPDDELRFADGNNTKVKLATKESVDNDGNKVTTTTVKVDVTGLPVQYTDKNGTPVTKVGDKYFTVGDTATEVKPADLTTNMVNPAAAPNVIGAPTTLGNVKSNLPSVNDADKNARDVAGNTIAGKDNKSAPMTAAEAAKLLKPTIVNGEDQTVANPNFRGNNTATVSDVLNAGWNLQNNGEAHDFVKPYDTVNFINGKGTIAVVETADNLTSTVKFDVDAGEITADETKPGAVKGPVTADEAKKLADNLKKAEQAVKDLPANATEDKKAEAQKALKDAQAAAAPLNKVATAQNVADMINNSGFTLKTSKVEGGNKDTASTGDEVINPGKAVEMIAGKNLTVKQEANGKVTYATKDDVNFNSLSLGTSQHAPTLSAAEDGSLKLGSKDNQAPVRISNVAPGIKDGDAVNVSQLKGVTKDLEDKIDGVAAGSNAAASLPQVYLPGKSMVAASVGTYGSQGALAVGYSSISDNGKWLIKGQVNVNTKAKTGGGIGVGYLW